MAKVIQIFTFLTLLVSANAFSQEQKLNTDSSSHFHDSAIRHLSIVTDFGINGLLTDATIPEYDWVNSKGINAAFFRAFYIKKRTLVFKLGIGVGSDGYKFKDAVDIGIALNDSTQFTVNGGGVKYFKSKLAVNYAELPMEFQLKTNGLYPIKFSLGVRPGFMFDAHAKYKTESSFGGRTVSKYRVDNDFNVNRFRLAVFARLSLSHFGFYGQYSATELFQGGKGPVINPVMFGFNYLID